MIDMTDRVMCRFCMGRGYNPAVIDSRDSGYLVRNMCYHCDETGIAITCDYCGQQMPNVRRWDGNELVDMQTWRCENTNCAEK